jgi:hypothetical protein
MIPDDAKWARFCGQLGMLVADMYSSRPGED